jgi:two-component system, OmpR family, phosphate regulon response regulator PhoB
MSARILIVEDEEPLVMLLRYNLEAEGYLVDSTGNGEEAELKLAEDVPDLMVLDWMIPNVSGRWRCATTDRGSHRSISAA